MLILIRGLPGSGKSTIAKTLSATLPKAKHLETDMYFINDAGEYVFDATKLVAAHRWCQTEAEIFLKGGRTVIVSNTFAKRWEMEPYIRMAREYNTPLQIIQTHATFENVHNVPPEVIEQMRKRWEDIAFPL